MPTMWQRRYASMRDYRTPADREREQRQEREYRGTVIAYHCPEDGYLGKNGVRSTRDGHLFCPGCGSSVSMYKLYASCPRCNQEHDVTFLADNCAVVSEEQAAKEVCLNCRFAGKRLPKAFKEKGATVALRRKSI